MLNLQKIANEKYFQTGFKPIYWMLVTGIITENMNNLKYPRALYGMEAVNSGGH